MSTKTHKILILDDDRTVCQSIRLLLINSGYEVQCIFRPDNLIGHLETYEPDLVLLDMNFTVETTGKEGLALLQKIKEYDESIPVILLTGWGTLELAVEGMKAGASDFMTKPWDNDHLLSAVESQLTLYDRTAIESAEPLTNIIGESEAIKNVKKLIRKIAPTDAMVLITGQSGTGKELVAEAIHHLSRREKGPFVKVNLGGLSQTLFESELFGHKKGAYTGAVTDRTGRFKLADGGSIFLDEIGEVPLDLQVKLLRVLQERTFEPLGSSQTEKTDARVISATHRDLAAMVREEKFREDLYYRVNLMQIHIPALTERREDIAPIANHQISQLNALYPERDFALSHDGADFLMKQDYPGNVRQLRNIVERTYLLASHRKMTLDKSDFVPHFNTTRRGSRTDSESMTLEQMEKNMVIKALDRSQGNITAAAESLGITRSALYRRIEKFSLEK